MVIAQVNHQLPDWPSFYRHHDKLIWFYDGSNKLTVISDLAWSRKYVIWCPVYNDVIEEMLKSNHVIAMIMWSCYECLFQNNLYYMDQKAQSLDILVTDNLMQKFQK